MGAGSIPSVKTRATPAAGTYDVPVRLADEAACTEAEGPGKRYALWFQGCSLRCPGCANPGMLDPAGGYGATVGDVAARLRAARDRHGLRGVTLLGGEPFDQPEALRGIVAAARGLGLDVLLFTGHTLEALRARRDPVTDAVLAGTDALVDGPYLAERHTDRLYLRGSDNQRVHVLGPGLGPGDLTGPNRLEVRVRDGEVEITGFPGVLGPYAD
ncbi:MAG: radical SAM protein [Acidobacteria bacterium]|nr:radical SAM protein [Acidobacteriota bacterium]